MSSVGGSPTKTQFYSANGAGRDSYIWGNNGGFCPQKEPCKIEELGKWVINLTIRITAIILRAENFAEMMAK